MAALALDVSPLCIVADQYILHVLTSKHILERRTWVIWSTYALTRSTISKTSSTPCSKLSMSVTTGACRSVLFLASESASTTLLQAFRNLAKPDQIEELCSHPFLSASAYRTSYGTGKNRQLSAVLSLVVPTVDEMYVRHEISLPGAVDMVRWTAGYGAVPSPLEA